MLGLAVLVVSVGLADSLNPSTVGPAVYLAIGERGAARVLSFAVGVFAVFTGAGIVLVVGFGQAALAALPHPGSRTLHLIELGAGGVVLLIALALALLRRHVSSDLINRRPATAYASFLLGAGIAAVELPTALPYFGVAAAIVASGRSVATQIFLLLLFNISFIAPLLAIATLRGLGGSRWDESLARFQRRLERWTPVLIPTVLAAIALVLLAVGAVGLWRD